MTAADADAAPPLTADERLHLEAALSLVGALLAMVDRYVARRADAPP